jgi:hypothetical protein
MAPPGNGQIPLEKTGQEVGEPVVENVEEASLVNEPLP